jgi:NAD(P)H-flavin reductase
MLRVLAADRLNDYYIAYEIEAPEIASKIEPGQLLDVDLDGHPFGLPHAIADFSRDKGTVTVVARNANESGRVVIPSVDLRGPLGRQHAFRGVGKILCVAEGLGVAALYTRLKELKARGIYTIVIVGFHSRDFVYWIDRLDSISNELYVVTEDGSYGIKGPIRQTIRAVCENELDIDRALAIGSLDLLKTCCGITSTHGIRTIISLNAVLVEDAVTSSPQDADVIEGAARTAYDWAAESDLEGHEVNFDELMQKLGIQIAR